MIKNKVKIAILAKISGGIYSGRGTETNKQINEDYLNIINEIVEERKMRSFDLIIFPNLDLK